MSACTHTENGRVCGAPIPKGKRKCFKHLKTSNYKVIQGRPSRKGANATGIAAHKPDKIRTRRAKRQHPQVMGSKPYITGGQGIDLSRVIRKPKEDIW